MCTFECKVAQGCEKPWSSPHAAALSKSPQVPVKPTCTSESDAMFGLVPQRLKRSTPHERSSGPSSRCRPSYSAPATRANQLSAEREGRGALPCVGSDRVDPWTTRALSSGKWRRKRKLLCEARKSEHALIVGSRSAQIGLDEARGGSPRAYVLVVPRSEQRERCKEISPLPK